MTTMSPTILSRLHQSDHAPRPLLPGDNRSVLEAALAAHDAGLCVVPTTVKPGQKTPILERVTQPYLDNLGLNADQIVAVLGINQTTGLLNDYHWGWKHWQYVRPSKEWLVRQYSDWRLTGLGIVCGKTSGNLEDLDFDHPAMKEAFIKLAVDSGQSYLIHRVSDGYSSKTPGDGHHLLYFCPEKVSGNLKLAQRPAPTKENPNGRKVLIETRGEGGYAVEPPSFGKVHKSGKPYVMASGGFATIATITAAERDLLHAFARSLNEMPKTAPAPTYSIPTSSASSASSKEGLPGTNFNKRATWDQILGKHGWVVERTSGVERFWRRPGKEDGVSASTGYQGGKYHDDLLYVFTSSTAFEPNHAYTKFKAYTVLDHGGDYRAAARELRRVGYGAQAVSQSTINLAAPGPSATAALSPDDESPPATDQQVDEDVHLPDPAKGGSRRSGVLAETFGLMSRMIGSDPRGLLKKPDFGTNLEDLIVPNSGYLLANKQNMPDTQELGDLLHDTTGAGKETTRLEECHGWKSQHCKDHGKVRSYCTTCKLPYHYVPGLRHWTSTQRRLADLDIPGQAGEGRYVDVWVAGTEEYKNHPSKDDAMKTLLRRAELAVDLINKRGQFKGRVLSRSGGWSLMNGHVVHILAVSAKVKNEEEAQAFQEVVWKEYQGYMFGRRVFSEGYKFQTQLIFDASLSLFYMDRGMGNEEMRESMESYLSVTRKRHQFQAMGELHRLQKATPPPEKKKPTCPICGGPVETRNDGKARDRGASGWSRARAVPPPLPTAASPPPLQPAMFGQHAMA